VLQQSMRTMTQEQIDEWNECHPVGSPCILITDDNKDVTTRTRTPAWLTSVNPVTQKGYAVVSIEGKTGGWDLDRVRMLEAHR
jgi:hypothetical protein